MKKLLQSLFVMMLFANFAMAQNRTITGTVTAKEDGNPLPGVTVRLKGARGGTQTSSSGMYSLSVPSGTTELEFSYIGFVPRSIAIGSSNVLNVTLDSDAEALSEVIVTGYGTLKKKDFTGSVSTVRGDDLKDKPVQSFSQGLTGQAAGVNIIQPNGLLNNPPVIRVRGVSSISLSSFPLVVVDGIPFPTGDVSANSAANNPLGDINPADIESIDILKDAASTALYGSRAAAGVLVITTKKGKTGTAKVTYDGWVGVNSAVRLPELLNAQQYIQSKNTAMKNALALNPNVVPASQRNANGESFFPTLNPDGSAVDTKWYDVVYRTAFSQNHSVTVSGGTEKTTYYLSGGLSDQAGFLKANSFQRYSGRANLTHQATNWLKLNMNMSYNNSFNSSPNSGSVPGGAFNSSGLGRIAVVMAPNIKPFNDDGSYSTSGSNIGSGANLVPITYANPQILIDKDVNSSESNRFLTNLGAEVKIVEGLTAKSTYSWDRSNTENIQFWNPVNGDGFSYNGYAYNNSARRNNWNWITTLSYNTTLGEGHNLNLNISSDIQNTRTVNWGSIRQGLADPTFFDQYQGTFTTNVAGGNSISEQGWQAYIGSFNYNYKGRYFLSGNIRRDGNSAFYVDNQWGTFGGGSIGWEIGQEEFFKNSALGSTVNSLRLRASYGKVGNANVLPYQGYTTYGSNIYGAGVLAWSFTSAANKELKWETSNQTDVGLSVGLFNSRITAEVDYFNKDINNLILGVTQAPSKGIPNTGGAINTNVGSMYNRGFEFGLSGSPIKTNSFTWTSSLNFTTIKNEVTALDPSLPQLTQTTGNLETASTTIVGKSIAGIYAVETRGINAANGRRIFVNKDGREVQYSHFGGANAWTYLDGTVAPPISANDQKYIAGTLPTWYGGFSNTFNYKNFDLNIMFTYSGGNSIYNGSRAGLLDQRFWNNSTEVLNAWTPENTAGKIPRVVYGDNVSNGSSFPISDNIEKGDFLRLQAATFGYRIPPSIFGKTGISSLRVYASVNNAFIITGYSGVDPEISSNGNTALSAGVERNSIPQGRQFTFGLSLGL